MIRTILILIITLIVVPIAAFYLDSPPNDQQWLLIKNSGIAMLCVAAYCFIVSSLTGNCSQVDKLWSIVPIGYTWYYAWATGNDILIFMAVLATLWGIRLTYNFARRGAYSWRFWAGEEDYRWEILRKNPIFQPSWKWMLFNLFFISLYQNTLIWLFTLPAVYAAQSDNSTLNLFAILFGVLFVLFLILETISDQQQWNFQKEKHRRLNNKLPLENYAHGFTNIGLWKYVRHPNYASEQAIWICFYFIGAAITHQWLNWSAVGCLLLLLLF
ncbi:MAG: DUF1295 domain-containing protein, partial [Bacteroidia bacterium]|nr:DUF1295 domain-containing protein [Bacteroidia bacterium]